MLNDLLPSQIDVRKLTVKGAEISSSFSPSVMTRLASLLANGEGVVTANLHFYIDEAHKRRVDGKIRAQVNVVCQRCLDPVAIKVESDFELAIVWTDDQAKQLPKTLEPLTVGEQLIDLADIVEEELILSLPIVSYHDDKYCKRESRSFGDLEMTSTQEPKKNPFNVLEQLKSGK